MTYKVSSARACGALLGPAAAPDSEEPCFFSSALFFAAASDFAYGLLDLAAAAEASCVDESAGEEVEVASFFADFDVAGGAPPFFAGRVLIISKRPSSSNVRVCV